MKLSQYFRSFASFIVATAILVVAINVVSDVYLRSRPELLMGADDRINLETQKARDALITPERAAAWFDVKSLDDFQAMMSERRDHQLVAYAPYVQLGYRPFIGKYLGATEAGYRMNRETGPWPPRSENFNVFFFGNSTAFGVGPYWATVASYLQDLFNESGEVKKKAYVYNFGRSSYISSQETVLFGRLLADGFRPDMAVFLDGSADFCFPDGNPSSWPLLQQFYNDFHDRIVRERRGQGAAIRWDRLSEFVATLPAIELLQALKSRVETPTPIYNSNASVVTEIPIAESELRKVVARYIENMQQVKSIAQTEGISPVFVWQPNPTYRYDKKYHIFYPDRLYCHINDKYGYPIARELLPNHPALAPNFVWAADIQEDLKEPLYVDTFHYTASMSKRIAQFIFAAIQDRGLIASRGGRAE